MKKYRVIGRNRDTLLKKTAEKLNVDVSLIGYEVKSEELKEDGSKVITLDVWIKENKEILEEIKIEKEIKEIKKVEKKKKEIGDIVQITIEKNGVYLQIEEKLHY